jgi:tetratricopeptide (TPR) repeat protein
MPLQELFNAPIEHLCSFLGPHRQTLRVVLVAPDLKQLFLRMLLKLDNDNNFPHRFMLLDTSFQDPSQYFTALLTEISQEYDKHRQTLPSSAHALAADTTKGRGLPPIQRFEKLLSALADAISQSFSSLALIMDPPEVKDAKAYQQALVWLAENTKSKWLKYLVLDDRLKPTLGQLDAESKRAGVQEFHFPPEAIEKQVKADMEDVRKLKPFERRQYAGLLAGFAFARKEYAQAERLQQDWIKMIDEEGSPEEKANALYNLGNTQLEKGNAAAAEQTFVQSVEICLAKQLTALLPMVLTNLGVALYRQARKLQALKSFQTARDISRAQKLRPVEAHVLDCLAKVHEEDKEHERAEQCWLEALALYEGITSEFFIDLRKAGSQDILTKLDRLYRATKQQEKLERLKRRQEQQSDA